MRVLTSNDYVEMLREKDKKEKEAAELKMKRKEERELKIIEKEKERERKKKEREEKKKQKGNKRGNKRKSQCQNTAHKQPRIDDEGDTEEQHVSSSDNEEENQPSSSRRTLHSVRPPSRYCDDFDSDVSTTVCVMLENHQSRKAWCSGWIATSVESGPTNIVHLVAIQQHATFYVHHVVCKVTF